MVEREWLELGEQGFSSIKLRNILGGVCDLVMVFLFSLGYSTLESCVAVHTYWKANYVDTSCVPYTFGQNMVLH